MSLEEDAKFKEFMDELTQLSKKHGVVVCGCGCCSSPYLLSMETSEVDGGYTIRYGCDNLTWTTK